MTESFDPYRKWLGIPPEEQPPHHYRLLGIGLYESDADVIHEAADRQMAHVQRHKLGQYSSLSQTILNELTVAKLCLLSPDRKAAYDGKLRERSAAEQLPPPNPGGAGASGLKFAVPIALAPRPGQSGVLPSATAAPLAKAASLRSAPTALEPGAADAVDYSVDRMPSAARRQARAEKKYSSNSILIVGGVAIGCLMLLAVAVFAMRSKPAGEIAKNAPAKSQVAKPAAEPKPAARPSKPPAEPEAVEPARNPSPPAKPAEEPPSKPSFSPAIGTRVGETPQGGAEPIDLLQKTSPARHTLQGNWTRADGVLTSMENLRAPAILQLPYAPSAEYVLDLTVERSPGAIFAVGLTCGEARCEMVFEGWGPISGLNLVNGKAPPENPTALHGSALTPDKPCEVKITVRPGMIFVQCDGRKIVDWHGEASQLRMPDSKIAYDKRVPFLFAQGKPIKISKAVLTPIAPGGKLVEPTRPAELAANAPPAELEKPEVPARTQEPPAVTKQPAAQVEPGVGAAPAAPAKLLAIPDEKQRLQATELVKDVYRSDFAAAKKSTEKSDLAQKLFGLAGESQDAAERYALLCEARDLARDAANPALVMKIVEQLGARYEVPWVEMAADCLDQIGKRESLPGAARRDLVECLLPLAQHASDAEDYDTATRLLLLARSLAGKLSDPQLSKLISSRGKESVELKKQHDVVMAARDELLKSPDDPAANLVVGRQLCLIKGDWRQGLPYLAKGSDPALKQMALADIRSGENQESRLKLADGWYALLAVVSEKEKPQIAVKAYHYYSMVKDESKGLTQTKAQQRLEELTPLEKLARDTSRDKSNAVSDPASAAAPTAYDKNVGSANAKNLLMRVRSAIKRGAFVRSATVGSASGDPFGEVPPLGMVLVGFNYTMNGDSIGSIQGIYQTAKETAGGGVYGRADFNVRTVMAKKGYAVGGVNAEGGFRLNGFEVVFMKVDRNDLSTKDKYTSQWQGSREEDRGFAKKDLVKLGGDGQPVVGLFGNAAYSLYSLGLVQIPPK